MSIDIIMIYIPKCYGEKNSESYQNLNILDLPGVESSNEKEAFHVERLMKKYLSFATVILLVCKANSIQSLETMEIPGIRDWRLLSHKMMVVLTYAYGIHHDWKFSLSEGPESVNQLMESLYKQEYLRVVSKGNEQSNVWYSKTEIFPVELGESARVIAKNLSAQGIQKEHIKCYQRAIDLSINKVRTSIQEKKSEDILAYVSDIQASIDQYIQEEKKQMESDLKIIGTEINEIYELKSNVSILVNNSKKCNYYAVNFDIELQILDYDHKENNNILTEIDKLFENANNRIHGNEWESMLPQLVEIYTDTLTSSFNDWLIEVCRLANSAYIECDEEFQTDKGEHIEPMNLNLHHYRLMKMILDIEIEEFVLECQFLIESKVYSDLSGIKSPYKLFGAKNGALASAAKYNADKFEDQILKQRQNLISRLLDEVRKMAKEYYDKECGYKSNLGKLGKRLHKLNQGMVSLNEDLKKKEKVAKSDIATLSRIREIGTIEFERYHDQVIDQINDKKTNAYERALALVMLQTMFNEFETFSKMEDSHEENK